MGILAVHITTAKIRAFHDNQAALGYLGHPGQIGGWWVPQNDVTMEAVRADGYFPTPPVGESVLIPLCGEGVNRYLLGKKL